MAVIFCTMHKIEFSRQHGSLKGVAFSHGVVTITANLYIGLFAALVGDSESMSGWVFVIHTDMV